MTVQGGGKMLITDRESLQHYSQECPLWQGVPGIEVTDRGKKFITVYSGGADDSLESYVLLYSAKANSSFELTAVATPDGCHKCFDSCLWIDPLGRLWFTWSVVPDNAVYAVLCDNPDADILIWSDERIIGHDVMKNKPTVLSNGNWLFPIAVWQKHLYTVKNAEDAPGSYVYLSSDQGKTTARHGIASVKNRSFDEHMVVELSDSSLMMLVRTFYGIGVSYSVDGGKSWTNGVDSGLGGPTSRFCIRKLKSGNIILVTHADHRGNNHLTALLSTDDGKTFPHKLTLDDRDHVSYPDLKEAADGFIYIVYDRERGSEQAKREILLAQITENDIISGTLSQNSRLKQVLSKAQSDNGVSDDGLLAEKLIKEKEGDKIVDELFSIFPANCLNLRLTDCIELDRFISEFEESGYKDEEKLKCIIGSLRSAGKMSATLPVVERVKLYVEKNFTTDFSISDIAEQLNSSKNYIAYLFKKHTGLKILDYRNKLRLSHAKKLLTTSSDSVANIAYLCGYSSESYFGKIFLREEGVSPKQYRNLIKRVKQ